jgi:hypothetical protein
MTIPLQDLEAFHNIITAVEDADKYTMAYNLVSYLTLRNDYPCTFNHTARVLAKMGIFGADERAFLRAKACLAHLMLIGKLKKIDGRFYAND